MRFLPSFLILVAGCALRANTATAPASASRERIAIVASERTQSGVRLVSIDEHGDRRFELLAPPARGIARDTNPAISPDGAWIVFASTRERSDAGGTSLWIAPLGDADVQPTRLTAGDFIDSHPTWEPSGRALVFASTRDGGDFDLYRLAIVSGRAPDAPVALTSGLSHEITPSVAPDGAIVYASITELGPERIESHLEERALDGTITELTGGPADSSPALSPDGTTIVFARPQVRDPAAHDSLASSPKKLDPMKIDSELWTMKRGSPMATQLADTPLTDESGAVWSRDGRFVFATSVLRGAEGNALFSSVVFVDLHSKRPRMQLLADRAGPIARLTPAIVARTLDVRALADDPEYLPELARIMARAIARTKHEQSK